VLRAVDLDQFAQAIAPPARLMRRGQTMPTVLPQPICNHPTAQGEMTPLCKIEVTHPRVLGSREVRRGGVVDEQAGVQPS
jgi:hypothetical protein